MNFGRKKFFTLIDAVQSGAVAILIVAHNDRLTRVGDKWFKRLYQQHASEIRVLYQ